MPIMHPFGWIDDDQALGGFEAEQLAAGDAPDHRNDYLNLSGKSPIDRCEVGDDWIEVHFRDGQTYLYDHDRPGRADVERMQALATDGVGLATYISQHVRERYAQRW